MLHIKHPIPVTHDSPFTLSSVALLAMLPRDFFLLFGLANLGFVGLPSFGFVGLEIDRKARSIDVLASVDMDVRILRRDTSRRDGASGNIMVCSMCVWFSD